VLTTLGIYLLLAAGILWHAGDADAGWMFLPTLLLYLTPLMISHFLFGLISAFGSQQNQPRRFQLAISPVLGLGILCAAVTLRYQVHEQYTQITKQRGNDILSALQLYSAANNGCPETLEVLFPDTLPVPKIRNSEFSFSRSGHSCSLSFRAPEGILCITFGPNSEWHCED